MLHYHGTPISPRAQLLKLAGRCFCVSFAEYRDLEVCHEIGQSVMLDNGAYTFWREGKGEVDFDAYAAWVRPWLDYRTTWCVIPDKIDGTVEENEDLLRRWMQLDLGRQQCAPVWHLHEPIARLEMLCTFWPRVCLGSSGEFSVVGDDRWHARMQTVMNEVCGSGPAPCWLHMLRGLKLSGSEYPFASADSSSIAQNHGGNNTRATPKKDVRHMAVQLDARQCAPRWHATSEQMRLEFV